MSNKEIEVVVKIKDKESVEKLMAKVLAEIVCARVDKYSVENRKTVYSRLLKDLKEYKSISCE